MGGARQKRTWKIDMLDTHECLGTNAVATWAFAITQQTDLRFDLGRCARAYGRSPDCLFIYMHQLLWHACVNMATDRAAASEQEHDELILNYSSNIKKTPLAPLAASY